jgi:AmmeMemoRadiSam system protein B
MLSLVMILGLSFGLTGCGQWESMGAETHPTPEPVLSPVEESPLDCEKFMTAKDVARVLAPLSREYEEKAEIVVVPHHALAADMTAEALIQAGAADKDLFIIIGPNHANQGSNIMVSNQNYDAGGHPLKNRLAWDDETLDALTRESALLDNHSFQNEHSIGMPVSLIAHINPKGEIMPIICRRELTSEEGSQLFSALAPLLDENTLIVASVDFSHHLSVPDALGRNEQMAELIQAGKSTQVSRLDSTYLDAPGMMAALMEYAQNQQLTPTILRKGTAADYLGASYNGEVTSYLTIQYR